MRFGSLFAGVGGFDLGLEAAGWECCWQVEKNKSCQQTLAYHWPQVPRWGDIQDVDGSKLPVVDVIVFGSPCQDMSTSGRRAGLDGSRSNLFYEATRVIEEMRHATGGTFPRYAVWENVVGALTSTNGDDFEAVLKEMADIGANHIEWSVLDAQFFGVPQRRRRIFVIAGFDPPNETGSRKQILSVGESSVRDSEAGRRTKKHTSTNTCFGIRVSSEDLFIGGQIVGSLMESDHKFPQQQQVVENKIVMQDGVPRRLTPIECERLMGWPDNHTLNRENGKTNDNGTRYKMCGNGVVAPVAKWIAKQLDEADNGLLRLA